jgi:hypothetical protein
LKKGKSSPKRAGQAVDSSPPASTIRRAKIICTVGPACNSEAMLRHLMRLRLDVARPKFQRESFGTQVTQVLTPLRELSVLVVPRT